MANTSEHTGHLDESNLSDPSAASSVGASGDSEYVSPLASESDISFLSFLSALCESIVEGAVESVEDRIERSKSHWSELTELDSDEDDSLVAEVDNVEVFKALQSHPIRGSFFVTFGDGEYDSGELVMGEKFAEGGQAELYGAHVTWRHPNLDVPIPEYVLKVFKKGTFLRRLQLQIPKGLLQDHVGRQERNHFMEPQGLKYTCDLLRGTLLKDGRFAFLLERETEDLRTHLDRFMKTRAGHNCGTFGTEFKAEFVMYDIALAMEWLHNLNIVHRDLKASNVLCSAYPNGWDFYVADFECSVGVIGTGFWRAPEILQACKDRAVSQRPDLFTKAVDVYSYGMTCYEILTGKLPFEGHPWNDYDLVLSGQRPEVPDYVDEWIQELLNRCWESNPASRPSFGEILILLEANSAICRNFGEQNRERVAEREKQYEQMIESGSTDLYSILEQNKPLPFLYI